MKETSIFDALTLNYGLRGVCMKQFFSRYSYDSMRMFLDQFAISLFGFSLALAADKTKSNSFLWVVSIASILFYLFLIMDVARRIGDRDRVSVEIGKQRFSPVRGFLISLVANSVNLIMALIIMILTFLPGTNPAMAKLITSLLNGMYFGVYRLVSVGGTALQGLWWAYFLLPLPALLVSTLGYIAGVKDWHLFGLTTPELPASDRPTRKEMRERREQEKDKQQPKD